MLEVKDLTDCLGVQVCARFTPCMHNFFLENFRQPGTWFERRLTYTRATAVNSMAGHLIGLGDRHSQNILVDRRSAEVSKHSTHPQNALLFCGTPGGDTEAPSAADRRERMIESSGMVMRGCDHSD